MARIVIYALTFLLCAAILKIAHARTVRLAILLIASYGLYLTWSPWFAAALIGSTGMNYLSGQWLRRTRSGLALGLGIAFNLILLGTFKYLPEAALRLPFSPLQHFARLAMPLGLSFWTFQAMSYLFDLYQGEEIDPSIFEFALYMVFFPVTASGPICRMPEMLPQFRSDQPTRWGDIGEGLRRIAIGVLMMQLAQLLGQGILAGDGINSGFDRVTHWSGLDVWCLAFGYGLQLFFDFAGYSHIAIGASKALGFTVPENFRHPFASTTPSIFWTRWHMSLSFWIRDYVFFPLMRLRREVWWRNLSLLIAMILFGLWHKATMLFLLWGFYHGVLLVLHRQIEALERNHDWTPPEPWWGSLSWITTVSLVSLGWIFFRANSLHEAAQMFSTLVSPASYATHVLSAGLYLLVAATAIGYASVIVIANILVRHSTEEPRLEPDSGNVNALQNSQSSSYSGFLAAVVPGAGFGFHLFTL